MDAQVLPHLKLIMSNPPFTKKNTKIDAEKRHNTKMSKNVGTGGPPGLPWLPGQDATHTPPVPCCADAVGGLTAVHLPGGSKN